MISLHKHVVIICQYSNINKSLDAAISIANSHRNVQLVVNGAANRKSITLNSLPENLTVNYYPSNREMEHHLILLNIIAHSNFNHLCYFPTPNQRIKTHLFLNFSPWSFIHINNNRIGLQINRKRLIRKLKNSTAAINQLRDDLLKLN